MANVREGRKRRQLVPDLDLDTFVRRHGRLPRVGDKVPPWTYRGFLLPYVIAGSERWQYFLRTRDGGKLLDEPIPQIKFGAPDQQVYKIIRDWCRIIGYDCGGWSDFRTLLEWLAWALAVGDEAPKQLKEETRERLYRTVDLTPLLATPYDYLGQIVSEQKAPGWNPTAFFPTPHPVCEMMAMMNLADAKKSKRDPRTFTVCDPCVGSGRMLLHASNFSLRLYGQDIDPVAIAMCKINGAMYAPWMSFQLPDSLFPSIKKGQ